MPRRDGSRINLRWCRRDLSPSIFPEGCDITSSSLSFPVSPSHCTSNSWCVRHTGGPQLTSPEVAPSGRARSMAIRQMLRVACSWFPVRGMRVLCAALSIGSAARAFSFSMPDGGEPSVAAFRVSTHSPVLPREITRSAQLAGRMPSRICRRCWAWIGKTVQFHQQRHLPIFLCREDCPQGVQCPASAGTACCEG